MPTDPTIYRFYEMLQTYGTTLRALVHEQFVQKESDPEGDERAVITLNGKFLPSKPY